MLLSSKLEFDGDPPSPIRLRSGTRKGKCGRIQGGDMSAIQEFKEITKEYGTVGLVIGVIAWPFCAFIDLVSKLQKVVNH